MKKILLLAAAILVTLTACNVRGPNYCVPTEQFPGSNIDSPAVCQIPDQPF